jgi:hypothetical protein
MATKTHKGPLVECPVCSGVQPERKFRRKKTTGLTAEISVRRQATAELGEEPTRFQKDAVFQKYGIHDPVIDRNVKKPSWKSEVVWKNEMKTWEKETAGLCPRQRFQESRRGYTPRTASSTLNQDFRPRPKFQNRPNRPYQNPRTPSLPPTEFRNSPRGS